MTVTAYLRRHYKSCGNEFKERNAWTGKPSGIVCLFSKMLRQTVPSTGNGNRKGLITNGSTAVYDGQLAVIRKWSIAISKSGNAYMGRKMPWRDEHSLFGPAQAHLSNLIPRPSLACGLFILDCFPAKNLGPARPVLLTNTSLISTTIFQNQDITEQTNVIWNQTDLLRLLLLLVFCCSSRSMTPITETHHRHLSSARFFAVSYPSHMLFISCSLFLSPSRTFPSHPAF